MSVAVIGSYPLGAINVAASGAVTTALPLLSQLDLLISGSFGLGALLGDIALQFNASVAISLQLSISNPFDAIAAQLSALLSVYASLQASLSISIPTVALSANLSISAALSLKLGGIQAYIQAALAIKIPAVNFFASLQAALSAGPVVLLSIGFDSADTLIGAGGQIQSLFTAGVGGILPGEQVYGVVLITKTPSAAAAMQATLLTA